MGEKKVYSVAIDGPQERERAHWPSRWLKIWALCMWIPARFTVRWVIIWI